ncbi:hypothetical protein BDY19DRAFT_904998 [Irpex rosettiformis]|uniref:Uncharacterized protein n=1 Tax=Irpex rosettiformis TaxID=378272 RepID=A0ACB8U920_9APHY|nr:hypothetical protein BDY19DRAFT_904998 [Irpex rosettiformis]
MLDEATLKLLSRSEIQKLARVNGIKANLKTVVIIELLIERSKNNEISPSTALMTREIKAELLEATLPQATKPAEPTIDEDYGSSISAGLQRLRVLDGEAGGEQARSASYSPEPEESMDEQADDEPLLPSVTSVGHINKANSPTDEVYDQPMSVMASSDELHDSVTQLVQSTQHMRTMGSPAAGAGVSEMLAPAVARSSPIVDAHPHIPKANSPTDEVYDQPMSVMASSDELHDSVTQLVLSTQHMRTMGSPTVGAGVSKILAPPNTPNGPIVDKHPHISTDPASPTSPPPAELKWNKASLLKFPTRSAGELVDRSPSARSYSRQAPRMSSPRIQLSSSPSPPRRYIPSSPLPPSSPPQNTSSPPPQAAMDKDDILGGESSSDRASAKSGQISTSPEGDSIEYLPPTETISTRYHWQAIHGAATRPIQNILPRAPNSGDSVYCNDDNFLRVLDDPINPEPMLEEFFQELTGRTCLASEKIRDLIAAGLYAVDEAHHAEAYAKVNRRELCGERATSWRLNIWTRGFTNPAKSWHPNAMWKAPIPLAMLDGEYVEVPSDDPIFQAAYPVLSDNWTDEGEEMNVEPQEGLQTVFEEKSEEEKLEEEPEGQEPEEQDSKEQELEEQGSEEQGSEEQESEEQESEEQDSEEQEFEEQWVDVAEEQVELYQRNISRTLTSYESTILRSRFKGRAVSEGQISPIKFIEPQFALFRSISVPNRPPELMYSPAQSSPGSKRGRDDDLEEDELENEYHDARKTQMSGVQFSNLLKNAQDTLSDDDDDVLPTPIIPPDFSKESVSPVSNDSEDYVDEKSVESILEGLLSPDEHANNADAENVELEEDSPKKPQEKHARTFSLFSLHDYKSDDDDSDDDDGDLVEVIDEAGKRHRRYSTESKGKGKALD